MAVDGKRRVFSQITAGVWADLIVIALGASWPFHEYAFYAVERQVGNEAVRRAICAAAHHSFLGVTLTLGAIALIRWVWVVKHRGDTKLCAIAIAVVLLVSPANPLARFMRIVCIYVCNTDTMLHSADHRAVAQACAYLVAHANEHPAGVELSDPRLPAAIRCIRTRYRQPVVNISRNYVMLLVGGGGAVPTYAFTFRPEPSDSWGLWCQTGKGETKLVSGVKLPTREGATGQPD